MKHMTFSILLPVLLLAVIAAVGANTIHAQSNCQDSYEPSSKSQPRDLEPSQIMAAICSGWDQDVYRIAVSSGERVFIAITDPPNDYDIWLYSTARADWVASSENSGTDDESLNWTAGENDTLYLFVYGYDGASSERPYTLTLLRQVMSDQDSDSMLEFLRYAVNTAKCYAAIHATKSSGVVPGGAGIAAACGGMASKIVEVMGLFVSPKAAGGSHEPLDLGTYCVRKYGSGAQAVATNSQDAYSWTCQRAGRVLGGMDMGEACRWQFGYAPFPHMGDRWNANSWFCSED